MSTPSPSSTVQTTSDDLPAGASLAELGAIVLGAQPLGQVLQRVADLAVASVPGVDALSMTLVEGSRVRSAAFTSAIAAALDERQYDNGFGPCLDAAVAGETVHIRDTADDPTYPDFARAAHRQGVRWTVSLGLPVPQGVVGALNLYGMSEAPLDDDGLSRARVFAGFAAVALANAARYDSAVQQAEQLHQAMSSRAVIEQAKGVLVVQLGCSPEEAFAHLSRTSQHGNRKLRDIAADVVARAQDGPGQSAAG